MLFQVGNFKSANSVDAKKDAIEAAKASSKQATLVRYIPAAECADRIRIIFDDSGSMVKEIDNAKAGVIEFLRNCIPNQTAVAVHFMNTSSWSTALRNDLPALGMDIQESNLCRGGTPFFNTLKHALEAKPQLTRLVAFTDGAPTDQLQAEENEQSGIQGFHSKQISPWIASANIIITIAKAKGGEKCIPIDTIFFGEDTKWNERNIELLKYLSSETGGYFLHFDPAKVNFKTAFKYLAPAHRLQLTSGSFRASLERGEKS